MQNKFEHTSKTFMQKTGVNQITFYLQKDGLSAKPSVLVRDDLMLYQTWLVGH